MTATMNWAVGDEQIDAAARWLAGVDPSMTVENRAKFLRKSVDYWFNRVPSENPDAELHVTMDDHEIEFGPGYVKAAGETIWGRPA